METESNKISPAGSGGDVIVQPARKKKRSRKSRAAVVSRVEAKKPTESLSGVVVLGFVFAGGCGTNNARRFMASAAPEEYPYLFVLVANTDGPQLKEFFDPAAANHDLTEKERENLAKWIASIDGSRQLTILQLGESGSGAGGDPEVGRKATQNRKGDFEKWMRPLRTVIIAGGAGKGTGGGALPVIQKIAKDLDKSPLTIVTMPFAYEGAGRMKKANATLNALYEQGPAIPIYNENVPKELSKGKVFKEIFDDINNASIQPVFLGIREVTQVVGDMQNVDIADWRRVLGVGNYVTCDYAKIEPAKEGEKVDNDRVINDFMHRLFRQDPYQDHRTRKNATGMLAWAHGRWHPDEVTTVVTFATDELTPSSAENLEVFPGIHVGTDSEKWMMILSVASEGPDSGFKEIGDGHHGIRHIGGMTNTGMSVLSPGPDAAMIYVPVEGQNAPAEVKVHPEVAERWKRLYRKHYSSLTPSERNEYGSLATLIGTQIGKTVFCPKV